jgi:pantothenate kinase-related protein Tda10
MEALKIEILNPKALQLIKGMQDLKLIKVSDDPAPSLKVYLKNMRRNAQAAPDLDEITKIVEDVRAKRYAKK